MEIFEYHKERYEFEFNRKDKLVQQIGLCVAILTAIGNLLALYLTKIKSWPFDMLHVTFSALIVIGVLNVVFATWYIFDAVCRGGKYGYMPPPKDIDDFVSAHNGYNMQVEEELREDIDKIFNENIQEQYSELASNNWEVNTRRSESIFLALRLSMTSIIFLIAAAGPFLFIQHSYQTNTVTTPQQNQEPLQQITPQYRE